MKTTWCAFALSCGLYLAGCKGSRADVPRPAANARRDAGVDAVRLPIPVSEAAPLGPSADRREVDVPLSWIYLLADPSATGSAPYAVLGARLPCGYRSLYATADKGDHEVRLRVRARYRGAEPVPAVIPPCGERPVSVYMVSLSVLRLGEWRVVDAVPHGPGDDPVPVVRVQRVVPDDRSLAPRVARWTRGCATDADCAGAGGECARFEGVGVCHSPLDGWLETSGHCPNGLVAVDLQHGAATRRGCLTACGDGGVCEGSLRCVGGRVCLPGAVP